MRKSRRWIAGTIALLTMTGVLIGSLWPRAESVDAAPAVRATLRVTVNSEAYTRTRARFIVTAPVSGRLQRLRLRAGSPVQVGQVVAVISPLPLDAAAVEAARSRLALALAAEQDAEARVRQARGAAQLAARAAERYRAVEAVGGVSRQEREEFDLNAVLRAEDLAAAEARARAARSEVLAARAGLPPGENGSASSVAVRAPTTGRVLLLPDESERIVAAGTPLLELGQDKDLEVVADVLSEDAVRIQPGAAVELTGWGEDMVLHGSVQRIEPSAQTEVSALGVDEQRVNVVIAPAGTPRSVGDRYRLDARITVWEGRDVLVIPTSAVFTSAGEWRTFVVADGRARERVVRIGRRSDTAVQVLDGLIEGDLVVLFPSDKIRSGKRVRPVVPADASPAGGF